MSSELIDFALVIYIRHSTTGTNIVTTTIIIIIMGSTQLSSTRPVMHNRWQLIYLTLSNRLFKSSATQSIGVSWLVELPARLVIFDSDSNSNSNSNSNTNTNTHLLPACLPDRLTTTAATTACLPAYSIVLQQQAD